MALPQPQEEPREKLVELIRGLPENEVIVAQRFIEFLLEKTDPFMLTLLNAPVDDEEFSEEDRKDLEEAKKEIAEGKTIPIEDVMKEYGL